LNVFSFGTEFVNLLMRPEIKILSRLRTRLPTRSSDSQFEAKIVFYIVYCAMICSCSRPAYTAEQAAVISLSQNFPAQSKWILEPSQPAPFVSISASTRFSDEGLAIWRSPGTAGAIQARAQGLSVDVVELGAFGAVGRTSSEVEHHRRSNGDAFWSHRRGQSEEWLLVTVPAASNEKTQPVAEWQVSGAKLRETPNTVQLLDADGIARIQVRAPAAFFAGKEIPAYLTIRSPDRIVLSVDAADFERLLLVDPLWELAGSMSEGRYHHGAVTLQNGSILFIGGMGSANELSSAELYDPATNSFSSAGNMAVGRLRPGAALMADGRVLVAAGQDDGQNALTSVEIYEPLTNSWSGTTPLAPKRRGASATTLANGKILVAGGLSMGSGPLQSAVLFDSTSQSWTPTGLMMTGRLEHTATLLPNGKVLVVGGMDSYSGNAGCVVTAELYNPQTNAWAGTGPMIDGARCNHTASPLPGGKVLVAGGIHAPAMPTELNSAEIYDQATNTWSAAAPMNKSRSSHGAASLVSGKVLVTGNSNYAGDTELFDPATGVWTPKGKLQLPRSFHTTSALANGKALTAGGKFMMLETTSELLDPSLGDVCASGLSCLSGLCADGVCCDQSCGGACDRCDLAADVGRCRPVPQGTQGSTTCNPYVCNGTNTTCPTGCTDDAQCDAQHFCWNGNCALNGTGTPSTPCRAGIQCASSFCVDAVCCDSACTGNCESCNLVGLNGSCRSEAAGPADPGCNGFRCQGGDAGCANTCLQDSDCAPQFACTNAACVPQKSLGIPCQREEECTSGHCADGLCCAFKCGLPCDVCNAPGLEGICAPAPPGYAGGASCYPLSCNGFQSDCSIQCGSNSGCVSTHFCSFQVCIPRGSAPLGAACQTNGDCASAECIDGVCCDDECGLGVATDCRACSVATGASVNGVCGPVAFGTVCRPAAPPTSPNTAPCDVEEKCTGTVLNCPPDKFADTATICRSAADSGCDAPEFCSGDGICPVDGLFPAGTVCRPAAGNCDKAEECSGLSPNCPSVDKFLTAGDVCRAAAGPCDVGETCTGTGPNCPMDVLAGDSIVCSSGVDLCQLEQRCGTAGSACPVDHSAKNGHACGDAGVCSSGVCLEVPPIDAGAGGGTGSDAGSDGGRPGANDGGVVLPPTGSGCGCSAGTDSFWLLAGALALAAPRRRKPLKAIPNVVQNRA